MFHGVLQCVGTFFSPDGSGNPVAGMAIFLLAGKSDQRKLLCSLEKKAIPGTDCNEQQDELLKCHLVIVFNAIFCAN